MIFNKINLTALTLLAGMLFASSSFAQSKRTWVSGVGDDANPCSRTAPGKTFAGAISKTVTGGEIDALDPGGFGTLTITKSITIDGGAGTAGVLASGVNGFSIVASGTSQIVVTLRNLDINGGETGLVGIRVSGTVPVMLHVENCQIYDFSGAGISFATSGVGSELFVSKCHIHENHGDGILLAETVPLFAKISNCSIDDCATGVHAESVAIVVVNNTNVTGNSGAGLEADAGSKMSVNGGNVSLNATGVSAAGKVSLSDVAISENLTSDLSHTKTGVIDSFGDNAELGIGGAATGGLPTAKLPNQ